MPIRFSVIIATKNRPGPLHDCLESFRSLDYPAGEWEMILVNDGGDTTFDGITEEQRRVLPLTELHSPRSGGPGFARNIGARAARGEYLAFTDDDCHIEPDWLAQFDAAFKAGGWDMLGGLSLNPYRGNAAGEAWSQLIAFLYEYWHDDRGNVIMVVTNNASVKRAVFEAQGGFDEAFSTTSEDRDFSYRMIASGYRQGFCPGARVWHYQISPRAAGYLRTQFRYGRGGDRFTRKHGRLGTEGKVMMKPNGPKSYPIALWSWLIRRKTPLNVILVITLGQLWHRAGRYYEHLHHRMTARQRS